MSSKDWNAEGKYIIWSEKNPLNHLHMHEVTQSRTHARNRAGTQSRTHARTWSQKKRNHPYVNSNLLFPPKQVVSQESNWNWTDLLQSVACLWWFMTPLLFFWMRMLAGSSRQPSAHNCIIPFKYMLAAFLMLVPALGFGGTSQINLVLLSQSRGENLNYYPPESCSSGNCSSASISRKGRGGECSSVTRVPG